VKTVSGERHCFVVEYHRKKTTIKCNILQHKSVEYVSNNWKHFKTFSPAQISGHNMHVQQINREISKVTRVRTDYGCNAEITAVIGI